MILPIEKPAVEEKKTRKRKVSTDTVAKTK